jgi:hypothetical protein
MKTREQILAAIAAIKADSRYQAKPALVDINAPLALIQTDLEAQIKTLKWVLDD